MSKRNCIIATAIALGLGACAIDRPPPQVFDTVVTVSALERGSCLADRRCVRLGAVTWFIDRGWVFSLDENGAKHYRHQSEATELVEFKGRPIALTKTGAVRVFGLGQDGQEMWYDVAVDAREIATTCENLLTLDRDDVVRTFHAPSSDARWALSPQQVEIRVACGESCDTKYRAVEHMPELGRTPVKFEPTGYDHVRTLVPEGGRVKVTLDSGDVRYLE